MHGTGEAYRFGPFELDVANCELRRDGLPVKLAPQPFTMLLTLVSRAGSLVTREELRQAVWGADRHVDFNAGLNFGMAQLRAALDEEAAQPTCIATVTRRGYRDREGALTWLERAAELHMDVLIYARVHPALASLQGQPRYSRVLERVGLPRT